MMRAATQLQPRSIFLGWYVVSLLAWNWGLFALRAHHFIGVRGHIFGLFFSMVIVVGCALPVGWIWERRIEERHQREIAALQQHRQEANLKLLVLQAQIEPHFLFNTLASLRALLREDVTQAEVMVDALVRHLRAVLPAMRSNTGASTLSDQVAICTSYLELMATRMEGRLTYRIDAPSTLMHAPFPPLMLLILVENAIKHGIEPKVGGGHIGLEIRQLTGAAGDVIAATVIDNGVGLPTGLGHGLGLQNIREQLALRYGEHATLSLSSPAEGGAVACIRLPLERDHLP
jgi:sensor histidine kinase YesM